MLGPPPRPGQVSVIMLAPPLRPGPSSVIVLAPPWRPGQVSVIMSGFLIREDRRAMGRADHRDHRVFMITEGRGAWSRSAAGARPGAVTPDPALALPGLRDHARAAAEPRRHSESHARSPSRPGREA